MFNIRFEVGAIETVKHLLKTVITEPSFVKIDLCVIYTVSSFDHWMFIFKCYKT